MPTITELSGKCICGAVKYTLPPSSSYELWACHCDMCRQWTSGIMFSVKGNPIFSGAEKIATYKSTPSTERAWCKQCGSNIYFRTLDKKDDNGNEIKGEMFVCAGTLDDYKDIKLTREVFVDACPNAYALEKSDRQVLTRAEYDR